jgi:hypothetical protein
MKNKTELRNKIFDGIKLALEKLVSSSAKNDDYLVISKDGKVVKVPAKELQQH